MNQQYKGFTIAISKGHGKAVKGTKSTATIQVQDHNTIKDGYLLLKQISFPVGDSEKKQKAIDKAKEYIDTLT